MLSAITAPPHPLARQRCPPPPGAHDHVAFSWMLSPAPERPKSPPI